MDEMKTTAEPAEKKKLTLKEFLYEAFEELCYVAVLVILLFMFVGRMATVSGGSMLNTLHDEDRIIMTNFFYTPERLDVVVVDKQDGYYAEELIIKRIIAMEGETVHIDFDTWTVTVDGKVLDEPYIKREYGPMDREDMTTDTLPFPRAVISSWAITATVQRTAVPISSASSRKVRSWVMPFSAFSLWIASA